LRCDIIEAEFEKYRIVQDRLYESDFDRMMLGETADDTEEDENE
jgi:hypothetical protein